MNLRKSIKSISLIFLVLTFLFPSTSQADEVVATISTSGSQSDIAINPAGTFAYVTNFSLDTVSVVNLSTNTITTTISVGDGPNNVAINPAGTFAYVVNRIGDSVSVIDTSTNTVTSTISVGALPISININPAGTFAYVTNYNSNTVSVIDLSNNSVSSISGFSKPWDIAINPAGTFAYVTNRQFGSGSNNVSKVNLSSKTITGTFSVGTDPVGITINPAGTLAYVANYESDNVSVIDLSSNSITNTISVGDSPVQIAITPNGAKALVANENSNSGSIINLATNVVDQTISIGANPLNVAINPAGTFAYFVHENANYIAVVKIGSDILTWVGAQSITCPEANPWVKEKLLFAQNISPITKVSENLTGKFISQNSLSQLGNSGVIFDTKSTKVFTATETLPVFGCKDKLLTAKINQPIQFVAGGFTLQSDAHGYIKTSDGNWHDANGVNLVTNTTSYFHTLKFTKSGKYIVVLTEEPNTSLGLIPTYGIRSIRFVIDIK